MSESKRATIFNRRQFLLLTAGIVAGCKSPGDHATVDSAGRLVDAGPAGEYVSDGVYGRFRDQGFFVVRKGDDLFALSSYCTHRKCKLTAESDRTFYCKCHGSTFDPVGKVTRGPAKRDLPVFPAVPDASGELMVQLPAR